MAISYPVTLPVSVRGAAEIRITPFSAVGISSSPFTLQQQVYVHQGECWGIELTLGQMSREEAETWIGALLSLNGREGTFLVGDPLGASPRGTWAGSPKVLGAHAAGVKSIAMDGFTAGATVKAGDWIQIGSGSSTRLHKVVQDGTADGSGLLTLEIWPRTRAALADDDTFTTSDTKGLWRLDADGVPWTVQDVQIGGIVIPGMEAL